MRVNYENSCDAAARRVFERHYKLLWAAETTWNCSGVRWYCNICNFPFQLYSVVVVCSWLHSEFQIKVICFLSTSRSLEIDLKIWVWTYSEMASRFSLSWCINNNLTPVSPNCLFEGNCGSRLRSRIQRFAFPLVSWWDQVTHNGATVSGFAFQSTSFSFYVGSIIISTTVWYSLYVNVFGITPTFIICCSIAVLLQYVLCARSCSKFYEGVSLGLFWF